MQIIRWLLLGIFVSCSDKAPAPAPAPPPAPPPWKVVVERERTTFSLVGAVGGAELDAAQRAALGADETLTRVVIDVTHGEVASAPDSQLLRDVLNAAIALESGRVEVAAGQIVVSGMVLSDDERDELTALVERAAKARGGFTAKVDLALAAPSLGPDQGFIRRVDRKPLAGTELTDVVGDTRVPVDRHDRVKAGLYTFAGSPIRYAVTAGRTTWVRDAPATITIAGAPYALDSDVEVVRPDDAGARSFQVAGAPGQFVMGKDGLPTAGPRYERPGDKLEVAELDALRGQVRYVVLHADLTPDAMGAYDALIERSLSEHFHIDWDGTIRETLDPVYNAYHAGEFNNHSVAITLNNLMANLLREPSAPMYEPKHPELARMLELPRPMSPQAEINGAKVQSYGYTDAQYRSLGTLLRTLAAVFPDVGGGYPKDKDGQVVGRTIDDATAFRGVAGHWHFEVDRWDPGPGMEWTRLGLDAEPTP